MTDGANQNMTDGANQNMTKRRVYGIGRYVVVVTTTTCRQLGNDTTYDKEKKNPTSHDVADTSAVSGRRVSKTRRHVFKTNCGRHLKKTTFPAKKMLLATTTQRKTLKTHDTTDVLTFDVTLSS